MKKSKSDFKLNKGSSKPFTTIGQQIELLKSRGLLFHNEPAAYEILKVVGYYRFSAYSLTLCKDDTYYPGTYFEDIYSLYCFDNDLRLLVLKYTSFVEIYFRSIVSYEHSRLHGPLGYLDQTNFESDYYHSIFLNEITKEIARSDDVFVFHHIKDKNSVFPIWTVLQCSSFGVLSKFFKNMLVDDKNYISSYYLGIGREYVENWLQLSVYMRNIAAHGGRFYNRQLHSVPALLPEKYKSVFSGKSPFAALYAICALQPSESQQMAFLKELEKLFDAFPFAQSKYLGFPDNWKTIFNNEFFDSADKSEGLLNNRFKILLMLKRIFNKSTNLKKETTK